MKVWKIKDAEGVTEKHAESVADQSYTLCGLNTTPDSDQFGKNAYSVLESELIHGRINCERCIGIIAHCKRIPNKSIEEPT